MKKLLQKKMNKKGFTLAELLIVVAIIGVLVAISIPVFTAQLNKAKQATDLANVRAEYAEEVSTQMAEGTTNIKLDANKLKAAATNNSTVTVDYDNNKITVQLNENITADSFPIDSDITAGTSTN